MRDVEAEGVDVAEVGDGRRQILRWGQLELVGLFDGVGDVGAGDGEDDDLRLRILGGDQIGAEVGGVERRANSADAGVPSGMGTKKATEPSARQRPTRADSVPQWMTLPKEGICGRGKGFQQLIVGA